MNLTQLKSELAGEGYALRRRAAPEDVVSMLDELGELLHVEEVVVDRRSRALLKSSRALSLHTDHHRADVIMWTCLRQSSVGGETLLVDGRGALAALPPRQRDILTRVELMEHAIFRGDRGSHPMITFVGDQPLLYYSQWLADERMHAEQRAAFDAFEAAIQQQTAIVLRLEPGDILAIDNRRMLHGRRAIEGDEARHLRRFWLRDPRCADRVTPPMSASADLASCSISRQEHS